MATVQQVYEAAINEGKRYKARCILATQCLEPETHFLNPETSPRKAWISAASWACYDYNKAVDGEPYGVLDKEGREELADLLADYYDRHIRESL